MGLQQCETAEQVEELGRRTRARIRERFAQVKIVDRTPEPEPEPEPPPPVAVPIVTLGPESEPVYVARIPKLKAVIEFVGKQYGFSYNDIVSARRHAPLVRARLIAYYLCQELTQKSFPQIGRAVGNRDHTTVLTGAKRTMHRMRSDPDFAMEIDELHRAAAMVLS